MLAWLHLLRSWKFLRRPKMVQWTNGSGTFCSNTKFFLNTKLSFHQTKWEKKWGTFRKPHMTLHVSETSRGRGVRFSKLGGGVGSECTRSANEELPPGRNRKDWSFLHSRGTTSWAAVNDRSMQSGSLICPQHSWGLLPSGPSKACFFSLPRRKHASVCVRRRTDGGYRVQQCTQSRSVVGQYPCSALREKNASSQEKKKVMSHIEQTSDFLTLPYNLLFL